MCCLNAYRRSFFRVCCVVLGEVSDRRHSINQNDVYKLILDEIRSPTILFFDDRVEHVSYSEWICIRFPFNDYTFAVVFAMLIIICNTQEAIVIRMSSLGIYRWSRRGKCLLPKNRQYTYIELCTNAVTTTAVRRQRNSRIICIFQTDRFRVRAGRGVCLLLRTATCSRDRQRAFYAYSL